jgi:hypothetical protein
MSSGFPELTDSYLAGQDVLYQQFNEIEFYVEDIEQEHFYYNILKRLFVDIQFCKIFPLNGKNNVKDAAKLTIGNKKKIYIVDLDFDEILGIKEQIPNLFYLERYSIENYLFDKQAICELIREKNSKIKNHQIDAIFDYNNLLLKCKDLLSELSCCFILIQKFSLGKEYFGLNPARDFDLNNAGTNYRNNFITDYFLEIEALLKVVDRRYTLNAQINKLKHHYDSVQKIIINVPGKYLLNLIKHILENLNLIYQISLDSLTYKLSKECDTNDLNYLYININNYMN